MLNPMPKPMLNPMIFAICSQVALAAVASLDLVAQSTVAPPWSNDDREAVLARLVARGESSVPLLRDVLVRGDVNDARLALRGLILIGPAAKPHRAAFAAAQADLRPSLGKAKAPSSSKPDPVTALLPSPMSAEEQFVAHAIVLAAIDMGADGGVAALAGQLDAPELACQVAAAVRLAASGTDAAPTLPVLQRLREQVRMTTRAVGPVVAKTRVEAGARMTTFTGLEREVLVSVGDEVVSLSDRGLLDGLLLYAAANVDPGHPDAIPMQIVRLGSESPEVRAEAARALGQAGPAAAEATSLLCSAARAKDVKVAREAVTALGLIGKDSPLIRQVLRLAASDTDKDLAARARAALSYLERKQPASAQGK